jgi:hypothetical protein
MNNEWNVRRTILDITHRWPIIILVFLIGSLIGWGVSYFLPSPYQAEASVYVAFNADAFFRNPDDYKNWELGQLNALIHSDEVLSETLIRLKSKSSDWEYVSIDDIRQSLGTYWRNAGKWRLVSEYPDEDMALQLADAWRDVIIDTVAYATDNASEMLKISTAIEVNKTAEEQINLRIIKLQSVLDALSTWKVSLLVEEMDEPIETLDRWHLLGILTGISSENPVYSALLDTIPEPDASHIEYVDWVDQVLSVIKAEIEQLEPQAKELSIRVEQLNQEWKDRSEASNGLTAYLTVKRITDEQAESQAIRTAPQLALIGGVLAVLLWLVIVLSGVLKGEKDES